LIFVMCDLVPKYSQNINLALYSLCIMSGVLIETVLLYNGFSKSSKVTKDVLKVLHNGMGHAYVYGSDISF